MTGLERMLLQQALQRPAVRVLVQWAAEHARRQAAHAEPGEPWPDAGTVEGEAVQLLRELGGL